MNAVIRTGKRSLFAAEGITCYILRGKCGDLLIDTGLPQTFRAMETWLAGFDVRYVFLTHAHPDHDWNAARLQKQGAKILLGRADLGLIRHFSAQPQQATMPQYRLRTAVQGIGARFAKSPAYAPDILLDDGTDVLKQLGFDAEVIALPGHTAGSMGILQGNALYCGDAFTAIFGKPDVSPNAFSPELMRQSLRKILDLNPKFLACGHGLPLRMADAAPVMRAYLGT